MAEAAALTAIVEATKAYLAVKYPTLSEAQKQAMATSQVTRMVLLFPTSPLGLLGHPLDPLLGLGYPYRYGLGYPWRYPLGGTSLTYAPGVSDPGYFPHPAYGYLGYGGLLAGNPAFTSYRSPRG